MSGRILSALAALLALVGIASAVPAAVDPAARGIAVQAKTAAQSALGASFTPSVSTRQIGARVGIFNQKSGSNARAGFRTWEYNYVAGNPQVCFWNGYSNSTLSGVETGTGGVMSLKLYVELNGSVTAFTWGGAATSSIASNAWSCSDPSPIAIPAFTKYRLCGDVQIGSGGTVPSMGWSNSGDPGSGDQYQVGTTSDMCASNTAMPASPAGAILPQLIIGRSNLAVWGIVGDSITAGVNYTQQQASGGRGLLAALSEFGPTINFGVPGDKANWYASNSTIRRQMLAQGGATSIVDELGINDITNGRTAANLLADRATIRGLLPGANVFETTLMPTTSSTDTFKTAANQTVAGSSATRTSFNGLMRAGVAGVSSVLDLAAEVETSTAFETGPVIDGGVWIPTCQVGSDGTHPNEQCERQRIAPVVRALRSVRQ